MKNLLIAFSLILLTSINVYSQDEVSSSNEDFKVTKTIKYSQPKNIAYINALIWIAESFGDANEVIKLKDKEEGIIVIKGLTAFGGFDTYFSMTLIFNEEECLVTYKNFKDKEYGYNTNGWGIKPNACYTKSCKKNYAKWYSYLESGVMGINERLSEAIEN